MREEEKKMQLEFETAVGLTVAAPLLMGPRDIRLVRYLREAAMALEACNECSFKTLLAMRMRMMADNLELRYHNSSHLQRR